MSNIITPWTNTPPVPTSTNIILLVKQAMRVFLDESDEAFSFTANHLIEPGIYGSKQMDHGAVAKYFYDELDIKDKYPDIKIVKIWGCLVAVLRERGYVLENGRLTDYVTPLNALPMKD